jgi:peroxiredoxin
VAHVTIILYSCHFYHNAFIQANGFSFPVLLDQQAEVINRYQVRGLPTTFIIDRDGIIRYVHTGAITENQLERIIKPLL